MNKSEAIGILGTGACLPKRKRYNDDPLYESIICPNIESGEKERVETINFKGFKVRHFFGSDESLEALTSESCSMAISDAGIDPKKIDRLYGYISVSPYLAPNSLFDVHNRLRLRDDCGVVPINVEYTNFIMGLLLAQEGIASGNIDCALIACGQDWTRHVDYNQEYAFSIGDGTGAVVVGRNAPLQIVAHRIDTLSQRYGAMTMAVHDSNNKAKCDSNIYYDITPGDGMESLIDDGVYRPVRFIIQFLDQLGIAATEVDLVCYQASGLLLDYWKEELYPIAVHDTLSEFGNMSLATIAVNLHHFRNDFDRKYVLLFSLGVGFHQMAVLLEKNP